MQRVFWSNCLPLFNRLGLIQVFETFFGFFEGMKRHLKALVSVHQQHVHLSCMTKKQQRPQEKRDKKQFKIAFVDLHQQQGISVAPQPSLVPPFSFSETVSEGSQSAEIPRAPEVNWNGDMSLEDRVPPMPSLPWINEPIPRSSLPFAQWTADDDVAWWENRCRGRKGVHRMSLHTSLFSLATKRLPHMSNILVTLSVMGFPPEICEELYYKYGKCALQISREEFSWLLVVLKSGVCERTPLATT